MSSVVSLDSHAQPDVVCTPQIMEYAPNGDLRAYLSRQVQPLAWSAKRQLCIDVARGLEYLHARTPQPVVHGDLKVRELLVAI